MELDAVPARESTKDDAIPHGLAGNLSGGRQAEMHGGGLRYAHERLTMRIPPFMVFESPLGWIWSFDGRVGISGTSGNHDDAVADAKNAAVRLGMLEAE
jgi:hypothetical protein